MSFLTAMLDERFKGFLLAHGAHVDERGRLCITSAIMTAETWNEMVREYLAPTPNMRKLGKEETEEILHCLSPLKQGCWYWVRIKDDWFPAKYDVNAAGHWRNDDTWEDFNHEVVEWKFIPPPNSIQEKQVTR